MNDNKVRIKVKKKKLKIKNIIIFILFLLSFLLFIYYLAKQPIKNIYITGNNLVSDKEIISLAELEDYPSFISTYFKNIEKKIKNNSYIKDVEVTRKLFGKIYITIEEERPLFIYNDKLVLSKDKVVDNIYNIDYVPYITNDIDSIFDKFTEKFSLIQNDSIIKISEIEYKPNELDKERFLFKMTDTNYVYINISTLEKINKYNSIVSGLNGKKGIIYLDSGDYLEIKD